MPLDANWVRAAHNRFRPRAARSAWSRCRSSIVGHPGASWLFVVGPPPGTPLALRPGMTDEEVILRTIRMNGFDSLTRVLGEWWCRLKNTDPGSDHAEYERNGETTAQACLRAVAALERATGRREM